MQKLLINSERQNDKLLLTVNGELDASTCVIADKEFEKALTTNPEAIFVDCERLKYISSAGIGVLISFNHACSQKNVFLCFCGMQPKVKNVLHILGIDKVFTIHSSLQEAIQTPPLQKKA